ncbi:MAG: hypothetical protein J1F32_02005 [Erysipelotrichales bacterium]|nr:hypothetical protein [Erysipelotrichales bacterium]
MSMSEIELIIQDLYDKGIETLSKPLPGDLKAACLNFRMLESNNSLEHSKFIIYDNSKIDNNHELKFEIAHEEMHLENPDTMYRLDDPYRIIKKKEYKCRRLVSRKYIPQDKLFNLIYVKKLQPYEIAEELCLTEQLVQEAYDYYSCLESWINRKAKYLEEN